MLDKGGHIRDAGKAQNMPASDDSLPAHQIYPKSGAHFSV